MKQTKPSVRALSVLLAVLMSGTGLFGADGIPDTAAKPPVSTSQNDEIAALKATLAAQQKQLEALQRTLEQQQKLLEKAADSAAAPVLRPNLGSVASLTPVLPVPARAMAPSPFPAAQAAAAASAPKNPCEAPPDSNAVPPYLRIGSTCVVPVGFMDMTGVWRDKNAASSIGTNFASLPYNNVTAGHLSEFRFSPQNSRLGFRADGDWKGAHFMAYNEFDFLGTSGGNTLGVTNGAFVPRLRLFWIDLRKDKWEFLAGQSWSMLTPNRKGISALPGDIFYSQAVDVNYLIGLTWTRQAGARALYHPTSAVTMGLSLENSNQYIGGSAGAPVITLPAAALGGLGGSQLDNGTNVLNTPNLHPDIIAKIAYDPSSRFHGEIAAIERTFKIWNPATNTSSIKVGGGVQFGANLEVVKNLRVVTSNFLSDGGGRYLFGTVPDLIVRADGTISLLRALGTVDGLEWTVKNTMLYGYYGGAYAGRNTAIDANGTTRIGYGYTGSANSNNRTMQEVTFGFNHTLWKNPRYGAFNVMGQYEYALRNPWYVAPNAPKAAHDNAIYVNIRYTLPGSMPNF
jgi:hypothetical protein